jgi:hypothetical protein
MRACSAGRLPYTARHSVTHPKARNHHWVMTADHRQGACLIRRGCGRWWCGAGAGLFAGPGVTPITPGRFPYQFGRRAFRYKSRTPGSISAASRSRGVSYLSEQLGARSYHESIHQSCLPAPLTPDPAAAGQVATSRHDAHAPESSPRRPAAWPASFAVRPADVVDRSTNMHQ